MAGADTGDMRNRIAIALVTIIAAFAGSTSFAHAGPLPQPGDYCEFISGATGDMVSGAWVYETDTVVFCAGENGERSSWGRSSWG